MLNVYVDLETSLGSMAFTWKVFKLYINMNLAVKVYGGDRCGFLYANFIVTLEC